MPERPDWMPPDVADVMRPFFTDAQIYDFLYAPRMSNLGELISELEREGGASHLSDGPKPDDPQP